MPFVMLAITLIGGPMALIELGGFRLLTDPTFDGPAECKLPYTALTKTSRPGLAAEEVGTVDAVLLSHDQHADNLDRSGRSYLMQAEHHTGHLLPTIERPPVASVSVGILPCAIWALPASSVGNQCQQWRTGADSRRRNSFVMERS
jgi:hypothetical protein